MPVIRTSREVRASREAVFAAFSDAERLARWWGPEGFRNTFHVFEFIAGGRWKFTMHGPNGADYANESRFAEIVPDAKVVVRHLSPPKFELTIEFTPSETGTWVTWVQHFADPKVAAAIRSFAEAANEQNLDRLVHEVLGGTSRA